VLPHSGQKWNACTRRSGSVDVRAYSRERPSIRAWWAWKPACRPKALPVRRWQAWQWHIVTSKGSPSTLTRS